MIKRIICLAFVCISICLLGGCVQREVEPLRICVDVEYIRKFNGESSETVFQRFLEHVQDLGGTEEMILEVLPASGVERNTALTRLRTEIMAGGGPDIFIMACAGGLWWNPGDALFPIPEKTMESGLFLSLDKYIENAQYMEWEKLTPEVMAAGRNEYGQQLLPISYTLPITFYRSSDINTELAVETTWHDMVKDDSGVLSSAGTWFHTESITLEPMEGGYIEYTFGQLADFSQEELLFTEEELLNRTLEILELEQRYVSQQSIKVPAHYQTWISMEYDEGADSYGDSLDPFSGIKREEAQTMIPIYSDDGGCSANILYYAAINNNTRRAEDAFFVLDVLFSLETQQYSDTYGTYFCQNGIPTHSELMQKGYPLKNVGSWYLSDDNYSELNRIREQIKFARFGSELSIELDSMFDECRVYFQHGKMTELEECVSKRYRTMQQLLKE